MCNLSGILSLCLPGFTTQLILFSEGKKMAYSPRGDVKPFSESKITGPESVVSLLETSSNMRGHCQVCVFLICKP